MFLKNKNIIFEIRRPKVADYAALNADFLRFIRLIMILSHFLGANYVYTQCIPNKRTAKVKSNEKRPSKK